MNNSKEIPRKQTTSHEDYFRDRRLEAGDNGKVSNISKAFDNGKNDEGTYYDKPFRKI